MFSVREEFMLAHRIQLELLGMGSPQGFADLLIVAIAFNRDEELVTHDRDFTYIREAAERLGYSMELELF